MATVLYRLLPWWITQCHWERFTEYLGHYPLPLPHIAHKLDWPSTVLWSMLKSRMREILKSGSVRGVEVLLYGRILWHSSIEREEQQGIQSMPAQKVHITSTRPRISCKNMAFWLSLELSAVSILNWSNDCFTIASIIGYLNFVVNLQDSMDHILPWSFVTRILE